MVINTSLGKDRNVSTMKGIIFTWLYIYKLYYEIIKHDNQKFIQYKKNYVQAKTIDVTRCHTRQRQNSLISKKQ